MLKFIIRLTAEKTICYMKRSLLLFSSKIFSSYATTCGVVKCCSYKQNFYEENQQIISELII